MLPLSQVFSLNTSFQTILDDYNLQLKKALNEHDINEMAKVFQTIHKTGIPPNLESYHYYLEGLTDHIFDPHYKNCILNLYQEMRDKKIAFNSKTYSLFIYLFIHIGEVNLAHQLYVEMKDTSFKTVDMTYHYLMNSLIQKENLEAALELHQYMKANDICIDPDSLESLNTWIQLIGR